MVGKKHILSFDCGNSSFRMVLGIYDGEKIRTEVIEQTPNDTVETGGFYYWDILNIYKGLLSGLKTAVLKHRIDSIGICTWGVDFSLFDKNGFMLGNPLSYRNNIGSENLDGLSEEEESRLFHKTGILCDKINSCYMLKGMMRKFPEMVKAADRLLMIPDILNYFLTGTMMNEPSELSTTQLMDVKTRKISLEACGLLGISRELFPEISTHGTTLGFLRKELKEELGISYDIPVIAVPSHDTAAAVLAVPAAENNFAFISSGTWALIGTELQEPVISDEVRKAGLTNEVGGFGTITLLKNNAGMFLIQRLKKEYEQETGQKAGWEDLNALGDQASKEGVLFDVNSIRFFNPVNMSEEIWKYFCETGQTAGKKDWNIIIRSFQESMALSYALTIENLEHISGREFEAVYIVGGGSRNARLCQATADCTGKRVSAGGKESTSMGNLLAQIKYFEPDKGIGDLRRLVLNSVDVRTYMPREDKTMSLEKYKGLSQGRKS